MQVVGTVAGVRTLVRQWRREGLTVGLVPTMGFLHDGHISLVKRAVGECDRVVVSVFVNPSQFGPAEDFEDYPRDIAHDIQVLREAGAHCVFHPEPAEMYAPDFCTWVQVEGLTEGLCGRTRPTHFRGVCTIVSKLFNICLPDRAYFGQKDAQQLAIIRRLVRDMSYGIRVIGCPIIREADGLARSSRNVYLSSDERKAAVVLSRSLRHGEKLVIAGEKSTETVIEAIKKEIATEPLARIDYIEAVDAVTMKPVATIEKPTLFAMAVYIGKTRLLDNFITGDVM